MDYQEIRNKSCLRFVVTSESWRAGYVKTYTPSDSYFEVNHEDNQCVSSLLHIHTQSRGGPWIQLFTHNENKTLRLWWQPVSSTVQLSAHCEELATSWLQSLSHILTAITVMYIYSSSSYRHRRTRNRQHAEFALREKEKTKKFNLRVIVLVTYLFERANG